MPDNVSVQQTAKRVLAEIANTISADSSEQTIVSAAVALLSRYGVVDTWYYNCPALVLLGTRSCLSISGRDYQPSDEPVGQTNLVTIDLSPRIGSCWGDCARTYAIEQGHVVPISSSAEIQRGTEVLREIHVAMRQFATPETRFCDLYRFVNERINAAGFENLDFMNNVGHSIATSLSDRLFISEDTEETLGSVKCFTLEPHIRERNGTWGFKHEDIYYFDPSGLPKAL